MGVINAKIFTKVARVAVRSHYLITAVFHSMHSIFFKQNQAEGGGMVMRYKRRKWILSLGNFSPACVCVCVCYMR